VLSKELPGRVLLIANGDPGVVDEINVAGESVNHTRFEIKRILRNEEGRAGAALDAHSAAHVYEVPLAGAYVVTRFVGFEMFLLEIIDHVAARDGFRGLLVVFDVVGTKSRVAVQNFYVAVRDIQVTLMALRTGRGKLGKGSFARSKTNLRIRCIARRSEQK
jgi:hypothetical protein